MNLQSRPRLIVIAGPNGSGKTSFTEQVLAHEWLDGCTYINADNIAQNFGDWNSPELTLQAAQEADYLRELYLIEKRDFAFETVFSSPSKLEFLKKAKEQGYFIRLFFIGTDSPEINAARVARRVMSGGHDVPITKIIKRYSGAIANCALAVSIVDRAYVYDNSRSDTSPTLLFKVIDGELNKEYIDPINSWAKKIKDECYSLNAPNLPFNSL